MAQPALDRRLFVRKSVWGDHWVDHQLVCDWAYVFVWNRDAYGTERRHGVHACVVAVDHSRTIVAVCVSVCTFGQFCFDAHAAIGAIHIVDLISFLLLCVYFYTLFFILFYFLSPQHLNLARRRAIWTKQPIELRRCDGAAVCGCDDGLEWVVDFKTAA